MSNDAKKLLPTYRRFYGAPIKGKRMVISIALDQSKISLSSNVNYTFPKLAPNVCVNQTWTPYTYRLCSKTPTQSLGSKTILEDFCVKSFK